MSVSHFSRIATRIVDQEALVAALADVGYAHAVVYQDAEPLRGYRGDARDQRAHVVVPRKQIGFMSNDIGFERGADGTYLAWISEFDQRKHDQRWLDRLTQRYAVHATMTSLAQQGFDLVEQGQTTGGAVRLSLRRFR